MLKKSFIGALFCLIMLIIGLFVLAIFQSRQSVLKEVQFWFMEVVIQDGESRIRETGSRYSSGYKSLSDSSVISIHSEKEINKVEGSEALKRQQAEAEKELRVKQTYLSYKNPIKVAMLDSLFKSALEKNDFSLKTALTYTVGGSTEYSCKDSTFYLRSTALSPVITGIKDEIVLQGYVNIPFAYVANKDRTYLIILAVAFCLALILLVAIWRSKKLEKVVFEPVQEITRTQIKDNLFFDRERGILYFNDSIQVSFGNYKLTLFILLLDSPEHFLFTEDLKEKVWGKIATAAKLNTTLKRLREDLEPIPDLKIVFENGGYRLDIL